MATVQVGGWGHWSPREVEVPATLLLEGQVWTLVREGLRGLLVTDEFQQDRVYIMSEPATNYYRLMTRGNWMPLLVDERF